MICRCCKKISDIRHYCSECRSIFNENKTKYCNGCDTVKKFEEFANDSYRKNGKRSTCKICANHREQKYATTLNGFINNMVDDARKNSSRRTKTRKNRIFEEPFNITKQFIMELWDKQNGKCALSGIPMSYVRHSDFKCSIERINNDVDYIVGNVKLIIAELNTRNQWNDEKIHYLRTIDKYIIHPKIDEIKTKNKILHPRKTDGSCRTCLSMKLHRNGFCSKCYSNSSISVILRNFIKSCKSHTKKRNNIKNRDQTECTITIDDLWNQLQKQNGKCFYSDINMTMGLEDNWRISVERLDVNDGYNKENIVFICQEFNCSDKSGMKSNYEKTGTCSWNSEKINLLLNKYINT